MKRLSNKQFEKKANKILSTKERYCDTLDEALLMEVFSKIQTAPHLVQGIKVTNNLQEEVANTECFVYTLYNPYMVMALGGSICVCVTDTVNQIVLFVDDDYMLLSDTAKTFTLYHELGHIDKAHQFTLGKREIEKEKEADAYALKHLTQAEAKVALFEMSHLLSDNKKAAKELKLRMEAI